MGGGQWGWERGALAVAQPNPAECMAAGHHCRGTRNASSPCWRSALITLPPSPPPCPACPACPAGGRVCARQPHQRGAECVAHPGGPRLQAQHRHAQHRADGECWLVCWLVGRRFTLLNCCCVARKGKAAARVTAYAELPACPTGTYGHRSVCHAALPLPAACLPASPQVVATPDIEELTLEDGDEFLIIACDGIWDVLTNQEVGGWGGVGWGGVGGPVWGVCGGLVSVCVQVLLVWRGQAALLPAG